METGRIAITVAAPPRALRAFVEAPLEGELALWSPGGADWTMAARGAAVVVDARGAGRFRAVREAAESILDSLEEHRDPAAWDAAAPRLLGGFSFACGGSDSPAWSGFGDASFVLPRWIYAERGERAFLRAVVEADAAAEALREARALASRLWRAPLNGETVSLAPDGERLNAAARTRWCAGVADAVERMRAGEFEKVVLARSTRLGMCAGGAAGMAARLSRGSGRGTAYLFERGNAFFAGRSPEELVRVADGRVFCDALGGSLPTGDLSRAGELLASAKDRREHAAVVAGIRSSLSPHCAELAIPSEPAVVAVPSLLHLHTPVRGILCAGVGILDAVAALHPTPAVAGTPRVAALEWIAAHEQDPRGWYAGPVGWIDQAGEGSFSVALRGVLVRDGVARAWAGAGLVAGSNPDAEWRETEAKLASIAAGFAPRREAISVRRSEPVTGVSP